MILSWNLSFVTALLPYLLFIFPQIFIKRHWRGYYCMFIIMLDVCQDQWSTYIVKYETNQNFLSPKLFLPPNCFLDFFLDDLDWGLDGSVFCRTPLEPFAMFDFKLKTIRIVCCGTSLTLIPSHCTLRSNLSCFLILSFGL